MNNLVYNPANHTYTLDGILIPSVTEIIRRQYPYVCYHCNKADICPQCNYARELGDVVHLATAYRDRDTLNFDTIDKIVLPYLTQWTGLVNDLHPEVIAIEQPVHYKSFFAGTLDRVWFIKNRYILIDIKSGAKFKQHRLQTSAYAGAWSELHPKQKISERWCVYLDGEDKPAKIDVHKNAGDFAAFLSLLNFTNWDLSNK